MPKGSRVRTSKRIAGGVISGSPWVRKKRPDKVWCGGNTLNAMQGIDSGHGANLLVALESRHPV